MRPSSAIRRTPRIAFQGEIGAYSEQAAIRYFGTDIGVHPLPTFKALFAALENEDADAAVVPIENALAGSLHENGDLLLQHKLPITGEVYLKIEHHVLALPGVHKSDIRRVISHPQALQQCRAFLDGWAGIETRACQQLLRHGGHRQRASRTRI